MEDGDESGEERETECVWVTGMGFSQNQRRALHTPHTL